MTDLEIINLFVAIVCSASLMGIVIGLFLAILKR